MPSRTAVFLHPGSQSPAIREDDRRVHVPANTTEMTILTGALLVLVSIVLSRASGRLGVPALLIFLAVGMFAGSEGPGGIFFDDPGIARSIGVVALALILFSGGLDTHWKSVRSVLKPALILATLGVAATALLVGLFVTLVTPFTLLEGLLVGAIVSSTDAAAVFSVLRSKGVALQGNLKPLLELESGSNDPMAVFLTVGLVAYLTGAVSSGGSLFFAFLQQMALGVLIGIGAGRMMMAIINNVRLEYEGLYPVLSLAMVLLTYSAATLLDGNGFLAVYIAGIVMGNSEFIHKRSLMRFHDGLAWLMQITMFLTLGLLVFPSQLLPVAGVGLIIALFLVLIARPVSVFTTLAFAPMSHREKAFVSWVGLRGAVPIILATFPLLAGIRQADMIFNIVFFIVLISALVQGTTIPVTARWLRVDAPPPRLADGQHDMGEEDCIMCRLAEVRIPAGSPVAGKQIVHAGLPERADIVLVSRGKHIFTPVGASTLEAGDLLLVLTDAESLSSLMNCLQPVTGIDGESGSIENI